jgi:hypothetical protein
MPVAEAWRNSFAGVSQENGGGSVEHGTEGLGRRTFGAVS